MSSVTLDLRMYRHSGIGRYLRNLVPLVLPLLKAERVRVIATPGLIGQDMWLKDSRVELLSVSARVYSPGEQMLAVKGLYPKDGLLWVPHYNVPLSYTGQLIVTIHDLAPIALPETFSNGLKRWYSSCLIKRAASQASAILTVSHFTSGELQSRLGVRAEKITVTYPGLDRSWTHHGEPHQEADGVPYLLYVGNVKPNKNLRVLLATFGQLRESLPHRLILAGRRRGFGTEDEAVLRQAEMLGKRVRWTDEIPDSELIRLYAGADALIMPSLYEGFGLPLLEAMQMGCPVICSEAGALREVGGDAALYFNPRDEGSLVQALLQVSDKHLMEGLRLRGLAQVSRFSYVTCAEKTADVLNRTMRSRT